MLSRTESNGAIVVYFALTSTSPVRHCPALRLGLADARRLGIADRSWVGRRRRTDPHNPCIPLCAGRHVVSPFQYTSILWGLTLGYGILRRRP